MDTSRKTRQREELCDLCSSGAVARAIDLAFEHFAAFGRNQAILDTLGVAIERCEASPATRRRYRDLCAVAGE